MDTASATKQSMITTETVESEHISPNSTHNDSPSESEQNRPKSRSTAAKQNGGAGVQQMCNKCTTNHSRQSSRRADLQMQSFRC